jgi:Cu2+-containing amine oxidase
MTPVRMKLEGLAQAIEAVIRVFENDTGMKVSDVSVREHEHNSMRAFIVVTAKVDNED